MRSKAHLVGLVPLLILVAMLAGREVHAPGFVAADTADLLHGVAALDGCLHAGHLRCDEGVDHWPPLQYIPALALKRMGLSFRDTGIALIYLNGLAVIGVLILLWLVGRRVRGPGLAPLAVLAGLVSPLLWYANVSFTDGMAAFFVVLLVAAIGLGWSPWIAGLATCVATLSKETAPPFLVALGGVALLAADLESARRRKIVIGAGAGLTAGLAGIAAFNLMRYGVPWNRYYIDPDWATKGVLWRADFFAAELVSPNAGILWFWPIAVAAIAASAVTAAAAARRAGSIRGRPALVGGTLLVLGALLVTFAGWWSPFGWYAWGSRFLVPWIPAVLCVLLLAWGEELGALARRVLNARVGLAAMFATAAVFGLAQLGAALRPVQVLRTFYEPGCPPRPPDLLDRIQAGDAGLHHIQNICTSHTAWISRPMLERSLHQVGGSRLPYALVYVLAVAGLIATARSSLRSPRPES